MANPAIQQLLAPQVLTKVISQQAATSDWLPRFFGMQPGGKNEIHEGHGREGAFHIYNNVRTVAKGRAPGQAAARSKLNPMGKVTFTYPRMHDSKSLPAEVIHNLGRIDNPSMRDDAGKDMIRRQTKTLAQQASNWRTAQIGGLLRGEMFLKHDGDDEYITYTAAGGAVPVITQAHSNMPAGNKTKLDMLGDGDIIDASWSTNTTDIPMHLGMINRGFSRLCGGHLTNVLCGFEVWANVIKNNFVAAVHGTSSSPFLRFERMQVEDKAGVSQLNVHVAELAVMPSVLWWITDEVLALGVPGSEVDTPLIPDNHASFIGEDPNGDCFAMMTGSEPIAEYDNGPETVKVGLAAWSVKRSNPTETEIFALDNALAISHIPSALALGEVLF